MIVKPLDLFDKIAFICYNVILTTTKYRGNYG